MSARGCSSDVTGMRSPLASLSRRAPAEQTCMVSHKHAPGSAFNAYMSAGHDTMVLSKRDSSKRDSKRQ